MSALAGPAVLKRMDLLWLHFSKKNQKHFLKSEILRNFDFYKSEK